MNLKGYIKKIKKLLETETDLTEFGTRKHAPADWKILLVGFALITVISVAWNIYLFYRISSGEATRSDTQTQYTLRTVDRGKLNSVLDELKQREVTLEQARNITPPADPIR